MKSFVGGKRELRHQSWREINVLQALLYTTCTLAMVFKLSLFAVVFGIGIALPSTLASNILIYPFVCDGSHYSVMLNIAEELLTRGHNVTMLVSDFHEVKILATKNSVEKRIHFTYFKAIVTEADQKEVVTGLTNAGLKGEYMKWLIEISKKDIMTRNGVGMPRYSG